MSMFPPRTSPAFIAASGPLPPDRELMEGLSNNPLLQDKISVPKLDKDQEDVCVKDCTYIGSYNWMKGEAPTILIPGRIGFSLLSFNYLVCTNLVLLINRFTASVVESHTTIHNTA